MTTQAEWWMEEMPTRLRGMGRLPRVAVLQAAVTVLCHKDTDQSILLYYLHARKMHDGQPAAIYDFLVKADPNFWDGFPTTAKNPTAARLGSIGVTLQRLYKDGLRQYEKEGLRGPRIKTDQNGQGLLPLVLQPKGTNSR